MSLLGKLQDELEAELEELESAELEEELPEPVRPVQNLLKESNRLVLQLRRNRLLMKMSWLHYKLIWLSKRSSTAKIKEKLGFCLLQRKLVVLEYEVCVCII